MYKMTDKWNIKGVEIVKFMHKVEYVPKEEQELVITGCRDEKIFDIFCSDQTYITKLKKLPSFTVTEINTCPETHKIIQIRGYIPKSTLSFRAGVPLPL